MQSRINSLSFPEMRSRIVIIQGYQSQQPTPTPLHPPQRGLVTHPTTYKIKSFVVIIGGENINGGT
ncbi:hypothetical protein LC613_10700 [Nostoc sphaeroides CHAB 2801]|uniref:hypothetical protein n=1 Tax=Nostoc sphaeroides TaxID=446679 RepID=UPI0011C1581E|nr:hypothetical protein [Nostoc sphaeroides]MCC5628544.1 hypothetical protein [Nostoc sphaeroides CHAB 2801]